MRTSQNRFPWLYIILAYGLAWLFWIPVASTGTDYQTSPLLLVVTLTGVFGPGLAGIILTYLDKDKNSRKDFWQRTFDIRRIRLSWIPIILFLSALLHLAAIFLSGLFGGATPEYEFVREVTAQPFTILIAIVLYFIQAGLEELGWRGYLLERLHTSMGLPKSSLVIGVLHAFWHLPLFWVVGTNQITMGFGVDFIFFVLFVMTTSVLTTWVYVGNRNSTLAATLFHTVVNLSFDIFLTSPETWTHRTYILINMLVAAFIIWNWQKKGNQENV
jgi:membrane protease YdiL (CAAX protease family)